MSPAKAKTLFSNETVTRKGENAYAEPKRLTLMVINGLTREDVPRKGENAFTERKRTTNRRNRVYGTKMSPTKAKTRLQNENMNR